MTTNRESVRCSTDGCANKIPASMRDKRGLDKCTPCVFHEHLSFRGSSHDGYGERTRQELPVLWMETVQ
jgi:hypothetical protein